MELSALRAGAQQMIRGWSIFFFSLLVVLSYGCKAAPSPAPKAKATAPAGVVPSTSPSLTPADSPSYMVFFGHEETSLSPGAKATLEQVAAAVRISPPGTVQIIGHAGLTEGGPTSTLDPVALSIKRAEAVKSFLVAQGIAPERLRTVGVGRGLPLVPKKVNPSGRNRRVEVILPSGSSGLAASNPAGWQPTVIENDVFTEVSGIPEYIVGPGDVLDITFWRGLKAEKFEATVRSDGKISFGFIEDAPVAGLTISEIDNLLTEKLSKYVRKPRIDILVKEYRSKAASIFGGISPTGIFGQERTGPGTYILKGKTTVLDLLIRAGGHADNARLEKVEIIRKDGRKVVVNLAKAIFEADSSQNIVIDDGDVVFVPLRADQRVFVVGEVNRQGTFIVDEPVTVLQAVSLAGGFTNDANQRRVFVFRGAGKQTRVLVADVKHVMETGDRTNDFYLSNNDVIVVPTSAIGKWNLWMNKIRPTLDNITNITGILLDLDALTPGSGTGVRGPLFRD
jgi:polysaccharide export outer membrane protein